MIEQSAEQPENDSDPDKTGFDDPIENIEGFLPDSPQEIDEGALPKTFFKWLDYNGRKFSRHHLWPP
jgi:hypothetical protein